MKKRIFSILLMLCMVLTFMPTVAMAGNSVQSADIWDGTTINTDWYTKNTSATEFTISTAAELAGLAQLVNGEWWY